MHPYYPLHLSIPHYQPNTRSLEHLLLSAASLVSVIIACLYALACTSRSLRAKGVFVWFGFCGLLHIGFEGYYLAHRSTLAGDQSLLGQLWKEYAKGDSKYLNDDDELVYVLESLTVFLWGPLCIFAAYLMYRGKRAKRVATAVCMAHLASCSIYLVSDALRGFPNTRPEALYFWGYLWAFNLPWIVVPWWILTH